MEKTFSLEIITPYRKFFTGPVSMIIVTSSDGELGILSDHEPILAPITIGPCKILIDGVWKVAFFAEGFLEMEENKVTVLVGAAEWPEEIDRDRAEQALKRAEERLASNTTMPWEIPRSHNAIQRAQSRLKIADRISSPVL